MKRRLSNWMMPIIWLVIGCLILVWNITSSGQTNAVACVKIFLVFSPVVCGVLTSRRRAEKKGEEFREIVWPLFWIWAIFLGILLFAFFTGEGGVRGEMIPWILLYIGASPVVAVLNWLLVKKMRPEPPEIST